MYIYLLWNGQSKAQAAKKYLDSKNGKTVARLSSKTYTKKKEEYDDSKYKFLSDDELQAHDDFYDMSDKCYDKLSQEERRDINRYYVTQEHSWEINEALREGKDTTEYLDKESFNRVTKTMDKACTTYTAEKDMASIRYVDASYLVNSYGIKLPSGNDIDRSIIANDMKQFIGSELSSKAYTSVSLQESGSHMFSNLSVQMKINIPKGNKMYITENVGEYEAILGRNTKMILKDVGFKKSNVKGMENEYGKILLTYEVV